MERSYLKRWRQFLTEDAHQNIDSIEGKEYDVYDHDDMGDWRPAVFIGYDSGNEEYTFKFKGGNVVNIPYEYGDNDIRSTTPND